MRLIPGYEKYFVASDGKVWSSFYGQGKLRKLSPAIDKLGRQKVGLWKNGAVKHWRIHQLVLLAFVGPCPENMECCHNNGDPSDNRLENLRYDTAKGNQADRKKHGTHRSCVKLTEEQVREIRSLLGSRLHKQIGAQFGVGRTTITAIARGQNWRDI